MVALLAACGARQKRETQNFPVPGETSLTVSEFTIKGVNALDEGELRAGLRTSVASWRTSVPWLPVLGEDAVSFNYVYWRQDLERIRTFYYAQGYFDAKVVREKITENPDEGTVAVEITISEGKPVRVKEILLDGISMTDLDLAPLLASLPLRQGQIFVQSAYLESRALIGQELERAGFAYVQTRGRALIEPGTLSAKVVFHVDPGPRSVFGDVTIEGLTQVERDKVLEAITFEAGDQYSPADLQETQERIYDLGVFALVKVTPVLGGQGQDEEAAKPADPVEPDTAGGGLSDLIGAAQTAAIERVQLDPVVPVTILVKEAKLWNLRVGTGVAADVSRQDAHGRLDWSSRNFLGGLRRLEHFNTAGYAWAPGVLSSTESRTEGVIVDSELRFTQPQFIERFTNATAGLRFQRLVEPGYTLVTPTATLGLRRRFLRHLTAEISYNFSLYLLSNLQETLLDRDLRLQPEYILEYFQQRVVVDFRNDFLNPTRGFLVEAQLQEATSYIGRIPGWRFGGHFDYLSPLVGVEGYLPIRWPAWIVFAARAKASSIYTFGRDKSPPIPQRLYAGGADSMRSFGRQQLSLYSLEGEAIPVGGLTKVETAFEPRYRLVENLAGVGDFWMAAFVDAATVLSGALFYQSRPEDAPAANLSDVASSLLYGAGIGAFWVTPIGPVRLDFAYTISDTTTDPRFRRCLIKYDTATPCPENAFVPISEDQIQDRLSRFNVILGIGQSF